MKYSHTIVLSCMLWSGSIFASAVSGNSGPTTDAAADNSDSLEIGQAVEDKTSEKHFDFYASDKTLQFRYERGSEMINIDDGRVNLAFLMNEERDNVFILGVDLDTKPDHIPGVKMAFGGKVYAGLLGFENADVFGLGFGLDASYDFPIKQFPLVLSASIYYAPDILTFGQSDRIIDWQVDASLPLRESIEGYVGIRFLQFDTRPGDRELDNQVHIGFRWALDG